MKSDVIIIGGGVAGLATGALLATQGRRVTLFEKGNQPGGRAYAYKEKGFTLNYGAHAIYRPETGLLAEVFRRIRQPAPRCFYPDPMKAFWADGDRFGAIGAKPHQLLTSQLLPAASKLRLAPLMMALRTAKPDRVPQEKTWAEWIDARTTDPRLRRFMLALSTVNTYTRHPGELSARNVLRHLQDNMFAKDYAGYMSGGWGSMYGAFERTIRDLGGDIVTGARVDQLEVRDGRLAAAIAGGRRYEADAFVCTVPPQDAPALADDATPLRAELERYASLQDVRAMTIDLGFDRRLRTDLTFVYDIDDDLYFSLHSEVTPDLAPPDCQLLHAMAYLSPDDAVSDAALSQRRQQLEAGLDRYFKGWREAAVVERVLPNARVTAIRWTPDQAGLPVRSSVAANLYFANDARDVPYMLSLASLAGAMQVADTIAAQPRLDSAEPAIAV